MNLPIEVMILNAVGLFLTLAVIAVFFLVLRHRLHTQMPLHEEVSTQLAKLQPWRWEALPHLWTCGEFIAKGAFDSFHLVGWIGAHPALQERPWVACTMRGGFPEYDSLLFQGNGVARTTDHVVEYVAASPGDIAITVNGNRLGRLLPDGQVLNVLDQAVGTLAADDDELCALTLRGRVVARVRCPRALRGDIPKVLPQIVQRVRGKPLPQCEVDPTLSPEERTWVLALAAWTVMLGTAFYATRHEPS